MTAGAPASGPAPPGPAPVVIPPEELGRVARAGRHERTLRVTEGAPYLDGHFPGLPVVPGVVQLQWVVETAREIAARPLDVDRVESLKFKALLRPGEVVRLTVELASDGARADFRIERGSRLLSLGRLRFAPRAGGAT